MVRTISSLGKPSSKYAEISLRNKLNLESVYMYASDYYLDYSWMLWHLITACFSRIDAYWDSRKDKTLNWIFSRNFEQLLREFNKLLYLPNISCVQNLRGKSRISCSLFFWKLLFFKFCVGSDFLLFKSQWLV